MGGHATYEVAQRHGSPPSDVGISNGEQRAVGVRRRLWRIEIHDDRCSCWWVRCGEYLPGTGRRDGELPGGEIAKGRRVAGRTRCDVLAPYPGREFCCYLDRAVEVALTTPLTVEQPVSDRGRWRAGWRRPVRCGCRGYLTTPDKCEFYAPLVGGGRYCRRPARRRRRVGLRGRDGAGAKVSRDWCPRV
jgi:hypothetical protein